jgi:hypothetical protein
MIANLARRALASFTAWRSRRRMAKQARALAKRAAAVTPEIVARRAEIERRRQHHRPTRHLLNEQREAMKARLQSELSATLPDRRFQ